MSKRNYTHLQAYLPEIQSMHIAGKTHREIAEYFGFPNRNGQCSTKGLSSREADC